MREFEYVIAGAGAAGLTLAFLLMGNESTKKSTLIIDKDDKTSNDRTWCFWEDHDNILEPLVFKSWEKALFRSGNFECKYSISPYRYKMIRGSDFYEFMRKHLSAFEEVTWSKGKVTDIDPSGLVKTEHEVFRGNKVFDSTRTVTQGDMGKGQTLLLQHFKGYFLKADSPVFDPETITYMDFNISQGGDFRFGYVLPFSPTEALVEYTIFSTSLLREEEYEQGLRSYIHENLQIDRFEVLEEEFGVIPMTDYPFPCRMSDHVFRIGISGGFAKPSTGYTFLRGQQILKKMVNNLSQDLPPDHALPFSQKRFKHYDSTLLKVLSKPDNVGKQAFEDMFRKNGMLKMFRFLDETTSLREEIAIMGSTPLLTFGKAFFKTVAKA